MSETREQPTESGLSRGLKPRHLQLIALGGVIGSGYFLGSGYIISKAGPASVLAYLLGGVIVYAVMLCLCEMAVARPNTGSFISYARDYISPTFACGVGWSYWLTWVAYVPSEMIAAGIIMNNFIPAISSLWWATFFGLVLTGINVAKVNLFGEVEFWLSLIKITALLIFVAFAVFILFGGITGEPLGTSILLSGGSFAPEGYWAVLLTMVIILVNFQGTEIIGLAAGESKNPTKAIPATINRITVRIVALYIIPMLLLVSIYPWQQAGIDSSVFADALAVHGFNWLGGIISFVILTAAVSCSNSGLYACSRALYALSQEKMAPSFLGKLNKAGVPQNAIALSIAFCWLGIASFAFEASVELYTYLLALSGFSGAIAWISICWSQLNYRRQLEEQNAVSTLKYKSPFFPYVAHFGIWVQVACLIAVAFIEELRASLYIGIPALLLPMLIYRYKAAKKKGAILS
ncbi:MAG: amino acid permease [Sporomusaceae bacterium]|jgi:AAT family amino acid transporter|nr:amino acid permease [Sporomusaceae bacterium]